MEHEKCLLSTWPLSLQKLWLSGCSVSNLGPVHTMPDKFENATLLLQIRLPSTLICIKRPTKTEHFENAL